MAITLPSCINANVKLNCIKIGSFGATDISAPLGSGINMSRGVPRGSPPFAGIQKPEAFCKLRFVRAGSARNLAGVFQKTALFSAGAANFKSLLSTSSSTPTLLISIAFLHFARKCFAVNPSTNSSRARRSTLATSSAPTIEGDDPPWRPVNAYDDGREVYIEFSPGIGLGEMPPLFVIGQDGKPELVNYRVYRNALIADRLSSVSSRRLINRQRLISWQRPHHL
jgi:hypothetical protein